MLLEFINCGSVPTWWAEMCIMGSFFLGLLFFRAGSHDRPKVSLKQQTLKEAQMLCGSLEAKVAAGRNDEVVAMWSAAQHYAPTPLGTLRLVVEAFLKTEPEELVDAITEHMEHHADSLCNPVAAAAVLDIVARSGKLDLVEALLEAFRSNLDLMPGPHTYEALLAGYAASGTPGQVADCVARIRAAGEKVTARGHALVIKGLLDRGLLDAAFEQASQMQSDGFSVPPLALDGLVRGACDTDRVAELLDDGRLGALELTADMVERLLGHCMDRERVSLAHRIEQLAGLPSGSRGCAS